MNARRCSLGKKALSNINLFLICFTYFIYLSSVFLSSTVSPSGPLVCVSFYATADFRLKLKYWKVRLSLYKNATTYVRLMCILHFVRLSDLIFRALKRSITIDFVRPNLKISTFCSETAVFPNISELEKETKI